MNYIGYFKTIDDTKLYSVKLITDESITEFKEIELSGDKPFSVAWIEPDFLYSPVIYSHATIKVVTDDYMLDLFSSKAAQVKVLLECDGNVIWRGYVQPQLYSQGFSNPLEVLEIECDDCLSVLEYFSMGHMVETKWETKPFGNISLRQLLSLFDSLHLFSHYTIQTKTKLTDGKEFNLDNLMVNTFNFFSEEGEPWTMKEVLEEIMKYFGFQMYYFNNEVFIKDFTAMKAGKDIFLETHDRNGLVRAFQEKYTPIQLTAESYAQSGADMSLDDVYDKITVHSESYNVKDILPDFLGDNDLLKSRTNNKNIILDPIVDTPDLPKIEEDKDKKFYFNLFDSKIATQNYYKYKRIYVGGQRWEFTPVNPTDDVKNSLKCFDKEYITANIADIGASPKKYETGKNPSIENFQRYLVISQHNVPDYFSIPDRPELANATVELFRIDNLNIRPDGKNGGLSPIGGGTKAYIFLKANMAFSNRLYRPYINSDWPKNEEVGHRNAYARFMLKIGNKIWNGSEWVDDATAERKDFTVLVEWENTPYVQAQTSTPVNTDGQLLTNILPDELFNFGEVAYKIPLPPEVVNVADNTMSFSIFLPTRTYNYTENEGKTLGKGNAYCFVSNLSMVTKTFNADGTETEDEDAVYENIIDEQNVSKLSDISFKITTCTDRRIAYSDMLIKEGDKITTLSTITEPALGNKAQKAEENCCNRYANQYSQPMIKENVCLLDNIPHLGDIMHDNYWNKDFAIYGGEWDYQYNKATVNCLEINNKQL